MPKKNSKMVWIEYDHICCLLAIPFSTLYTILRTLLLCNVVTLGNFHINLETIPNDYLEIKVHATRIITAVDV